MNRLARKALLFAAGLLLLLFFTNNFGLIDIQKTAIVTAIGIDAAEGGRFDVTAQIAVPDASGADTAGNVTVRGTETVGGAVAELNRKTGWFPTLVHCSLILLGENIAKQDVFRALDYFLRSEYVEDSCLVALCEGSAADTLGVNSPIGDLASAAIEKVLSAEAQKTGLVCVTNLRDFAKGYFSEGKSGFLPQLAPLQQAKSEGGSGQSVGGQEGGGGKAGGGENVFDASRTALFARGRQVALLETEETLAYNLAVSGTDMAYGDVRLQEGEEEVVYHLKMNIGKKSRRLRLQGGEPVLEFHIRARAQVVDASKAGTRTEIAETAIVPDAVLRAAEARFEEELRAAADKAHAGGCDLFALRQELHRFHPREYEALQGNLLDAVRIVCDIRFETMR